MTEFKESRYKEYVLGTTRKSLTDRIKELEGSLEARCRERDDLQQRVDNCNKNAGREIKRLRKALGEYGHHKPRCKIDPCDCGILAALKEKP